MAGGEGVVGEGSGGSGRRVGGVGEDGAGTPERSTGSGVGKRALRPSPAVGSARPTPPAKRGKCEACGGGGVECAAEVEGVVMSPPRKCARCGGTGLVGALGDVGGGGGVSAPALPPFPAALLAVAGASDPKGEGGDGGVGGAAEDVAGAAAGARRSSEPGAREEDVARWRRFTPSAVDASRCLARVWNGGCGGQCTRRPQAGADLCAGHARNVAKDAWLGKVTGEIPAKKLREFEKARKKTEAIAGATSGGAHEKGGGVGEGAVSVGAEALKSKTEGAEERGALARGAEEGGMKRLRRAGFQVKGFGEDLGAGAGGAVGAGSAIAPGGGDCELRQEREVLGVAVGETGAGEGRANRSRRGRGGGGRGERVVGAAGEAARVRGAGSRRIVSGFGEERVEDVGGLAARREEEALARHRLRAEEGARGRAVDFHGQDLDRGAGGAFSLGRGGRRGDGGDRGQ